MKSKNLSIIIIILLFVLSFFFLYFINYYNNIKIERSYYYFNMIHSLKSNDKRNTRYYAKHILNLPSKTVYYDLALLFLYEDMKEKNKDRKILNFCKKTIKNKKLELNNVIEECNEMLYKNIK